MKRIGSVIEIKEKDISAYKELHANQWIEVEHALRGANLTNYSIYLRKLPDKKHYLFSYFEYQGNNLTLDMEILSKNPKVLEWWDLCKPMHTPLEDRKSDEWWVAMEEVFHQD